jgi:hypothetical protein
MSSLLCVGYTPILYIRWRLGLFTARLLVGRVRLCRVRENGDPKGIDSSGLGLKRQEVCVILISSSSTFKTFPGDGLTALYIKSLCIIIGSADGYTPSPICALVKLV